MTERAALALVRLSTVLGYRALVVALFVAVLTPALAQPAAPPAEVLLVFGSDTSTPGISVSQRTTLYHAGGFDLFASPTGAAARVMDDAFRNRYLDAYGQPLRLTWWMQNGSLYTPAENTNVPRTSTMSTYLMRTYHGPALDRLGDELTFHYHTWDWTDADGDGRYYWNQTPTFDATVRSDFDRTMADGLLFEGMYPASFRSGWHFMDNAWQARLDELVPFSLHNDAPHVHEDPVEPIDNLYDWSRAPLAFVPFRPRADDYQRPGGRGGWNVRSVSLRLVHEAMVRGLFEAARAGETQVACFWGHLADPAFVGRLEDALALVETVAAAYPDVPFRYETGAGAMRRWQDRGDATPPELTLTPVAGGTRYRLTASEPIFQPVPFVAALDRYERSRLLDAAPVGPLTWETTEPLDPAALARVAAAVTDSAGHVTTAVHRLLPDDVYVDNRADGYAESAGQWSTVEATAIDHVWGPDVRAATLTEGAEAAAAWTVAAPAAGDYHAFVRMPAVDAAAAGVTVVLRTGGAVIAEQTWDEPPPTEVWLFAGAVTLAAGAEATVEVRASGDGQPGAVLGADVLRLTARIRDRQLVLPGPELDLGTAVVGEPTDAALRLQNLGVEPLRITALETPSGLVEPGVPLPVVLGPLETREVPVRLFTEVRGTVRDTLLLESDDPTAPVRHVPVHVLGRGPFDLVDDGEEGYAEVGTWHTSVTQAFGPRSRYAFIPSGEARASFTLHAPRDGAFTLQYIVPETSNAAVRADYDVRVEGAPVGTYRVDQNAGSGAWRTLGLLTLEEGDEVVVEVRADDPDQPSQVLRADAVMLEHVGDDVATVILDDAQPAHYSEVGSGWATSVTQAHGTSSRYAPWGGDPRATFSTTALATGAYVVEMIVPETVNASRAAQYRIVRDGSAVGSLVIDQNEGSGMWRVLGVWPVAAGETLAVEVSNAEAESSARVLRADAVRLTYGVAVGTEAPAALPTTAVLDPVYPNPSVGAARAAFHLPEPGAVEVALYDVVGRRVAVATVGDRPAGTHTLVLDPDALGLAAGPYFVRLRTPGGVVAKPWVVVR